MNPRVKSLWLEALRSGQYNYGRLRIRQTHDGTVQHCVLGVLADLYCKETGKDFAALFGGEADDAVVLPDEVFEWAEIGQYMEEPLDGIPFDFDAPELWLGEYISALNDETIHGNYDLAAKFIEGHV